MCGASNVSRTDFRTIQRGKQVVSSDLQFFPRPILYLSLLKYFHSTFDGDWELDITEELERIVRLSYITLIHNPCFVPQLPPFFFVDGLHGCTRISGREISYLPADQIPQQQQISPIIAGRTQEHYLLSLGDAHVTFLDKHLLNGHNK
jgi:hypothetical protein